MNNTKDMQVNYRKHTNETEGETREIQGKYRKDKSNYSLVSNMTEYDLFGLQ